MSEKEKKKDFRTSIGGQALIEGILMRGPKKQSVVVRTGDGMVSKAEELKLLKDKYPIVGVPIIRGAVNLISSMVSGVRALMYSAEFIIDEEDGKETPDPKEKAGGDSEKSDKWVVALSVTIGVAVSVGLFILLPTFLAGIFTNIITSTIIKNLIEGVIRVTIFIIYLWLASKLRDMKRVWAYHGAEHKTIFCYEKQLPLTVENARAQKRLHPRCGTSFMFIVMIVAILVFSLVSWSNVWIRMGLRILLLPVVIGISYEIIKWAGRHDNILTRIVSAPGKALQRLTTREPDDGMLEVAIAALTLVLPETEGEDKW